MSERKREQPPQESPKDQLERVKKQLDVSTMNIINQISTEGLRGASKVVPEIYETTPPSRDAVLISLEEIKAGIETRPCELGLTVSYFRRRPAYVLSPEGFQTLMCLPEDEIAIYPIKSYTYSPRIVTPVRGKKCIHYEAMDLEYLLREAPKRGWRCPVCSRKLSLDSIYIDEGLRDKLSKVSKSDCDLLLYSKKSKVYTKIRSKEFSEGITNKAQKLELQEDFRSRLIPQEGENALYAFRSPWVTSDRCHLEVPLQLISKPKESGKKIVLVPLVVLGEKSVASSVQTYLVSHIIKGDNSYRFVMFVPSMLKCGYETKLMLLKTVAELGKKTLCAMIIPDKKGMDEYNEFSAMLKGEAHIKYFRLVNEFTSEVAGNFTDDSLDKLMDLLKNKISDQLGVGSLSVDNGEFTEEKNIKTMEGLFRDAFEASIVRFAIPPESSSKGMKMTVGRSGLLFRFPLDLKTCKPRNCPLRFSCFQGESAAKLCVPRSVLPILETNGKCLIYFPWTSANVCDNTGFSMIVGPKSVNAENVVVPMMIADCTAVFSENLDDSIVRAIIAAKNKYPCLAGKEVFVNTICKLPEFQKSFDKDFSPIKVSLGADKRVLFQSDLNMWVRSIDPYSKPQTVNDHFKVLQEFELKRFVSNENYLIPFYEKNLQSLTSAIRGRLIGFNGKYRVMKADVTIEDIVYSITMDK